MNHKLFRKLLSGGSIIGLPSTIHLINKNGYVQTSIKAKIIERGTKKISFSNLFNMATNITNEY